MRILIADSVKVLALAAACAAGGLEATRVGDDVVLRPQAERDTALNYSQMSDAELLGRLRVSFAGQVPVVREVVRRFERVAGELSAVDTELRRMESEPVPAPGNDAAAVRAQVRTLQESLLELYNTLGTLGAAPTPAARSKVSA